MHWPGGNAKGRRRALLEGRVASDFICGTRAPGPKMGFGSAATGLHGKEMPIGHVFAFIFPRVCIFTLWRRSRPDAPLRSCVLWHTSDCLYLDWKILIFLPF